MKEKSWDRENNHMRGGHRRDKSLTGRINWPCSSKFRLVVLIYRLALISIDRLAIDFSRLANRVQQADPRYGSSKQWNLARDRYRRK